MKNITIILVVTLSLAFAAEIRADECMEGDCDNGFGTGFTDNSLIYEGEWKGGVPHGKGTLYKSGGQRVEGTWEKGKLITEKSSSEENKPSKEK